MPWTPLICENRDARGFPSLPSQGLQGQCHRCCERPLALGSAVGQRWRRCVLGPRTGGLAAPTGVELSFLPSPQGESALSLFHESGRTWRCNHGRTLRTEDIWGGGAVDIVPGSSCSLLRGLERWSRQTDFLTRFQGTVSTRQDPGRGLTASLRSARRIRRSGSSGTRKDLFVKAQHKLLSTVPLACDAGRGVPADGPRGGRGYTDFGTNSTGNDSENQPRQDSWRAVLLDL